MNFQNGRKIFTLWTFGCPTYNWTETRPISCLKFQLQSKIRKPQYWNARRRNEVRWHPGQETSLVPICSNPRSLGRKCTVLKDLWHCWDLSAPGELFPLAPLVTLLLEWSSFEAPIVHESFVLFVLKPFFNQIIHFFILQMLHDGRVQTRICYIFASISQCFCWILSFVVMGNK